MAPVLEAIFCVFSDYTRTSKLISKFKTVLLSEYFRFAEWCEVKLVHSNQLLFSNSLVFLNASTCISINLVLKLVCLPSLF